MTKSFIPENAAADADQGTDSPGFTEVRSNCTTPDHQREGPQRSLTAACVVRLMTARVHSEQPCADSISSF